MEFEILHQGINPSIVHRIPHGTLLNPYLGHPRYKLEEELGLRPDLIEGAILVVPGFLRKDKGLDTLLDALSKLLEMRHRMTLIVGGEPKDLDVLEMLHEAAEKINLIILDRYLSSDEILKLAALADAIVLPYRDKYGLYSVSGILHLSMGSFKPLIGTRVPRLIELYQFAPRATSPKDSKKLSMRIKWLIENYDYAVAYMTSLYSYAVRTQWIRMARRHLNLYNQLLKRSD